MAKKTKTESIAAAYEYDTTKIRDKDGHLRSSRGNNDAVAKAMLLHVAGGGDMDSVTHANKLDDRMKPHAKKQHGLKRMILGVMLRALVRNGTPVKIGKERIEKLSQKVELPKVEKIERRAVEGKPVRAKRGKVAKTAKPRKARASKAEVAAAA